MVKVKLQVLLIPALHEDVNTGELDRSSIKRFLHLAEPESELTTVKIDIQSRFKKLYPNEQELAIDKLQDNDLCDLDPDFTVEDVLSSKDVLRVIVENSFQHANMTNGGYDSSTPFSHKSIIPGRHHSTSPPDLENRKRVQDYFETPNSNIPSKLARKNTSYAASIPEITPLKLTVAKKRRKAGNTPGDANTSGGPEVDESNISLPPPEQENNRTIPVKHLTVHSSVLPGKRITSGMLNIPLHSQQEKDDFLSTSAPNKHTIISSEDSYSEEELSPERSQGNPYGSNHIHTGPHNTLVEPTSDIIPHGSLNSSPKKAVQVSNSPENSSSLESESRESEEPQDVQEPASAADLQKDDTVSKADIMKMFYSIHSPAASEMRNHRPPHNSIMKSLAIDMVDANPLLSRDTRRAAARRATSRIPASLAGKPLEEENGRSQIKENGRESLRKPEAEKAVEHTLEQGTTNTLPIPSATLAPYSTIHSTQIESEKTQDLQSIQKEVNGSAIKLLSTQAPQEATVAVNATANTIPVSILQVESSQSHAEIPNNVSSVDAPSAAAAVPKVPTLPIPTKVGGIGGVHVPLSPPNSDISPPELAGKDRNLQKITSTNVSRRLSGLSDRNRKNPAQTRIRKLVKKLKQFDHELTSHLIPAKKYVTKFTQIPFDSDSSDSADELILNRKIILGNREHDSSETESQPAHHPNASNADEQTSHLSIQPEVPSNVSIQVFGTTSNESNSTISAGASTDADTKSNSVSQKDYSTTETTNGKEAANSVSNSAVETSSNKPENSSSNSESNESASSTSNSSSVKSNTTPIYRPSSSTGPAPESPKPSTAIQAIHDRTKALEEMKKRSLEEKKKFLNPKDTSAVPTPAVTVAKAIPVNNNVSISSGTSIPKKVSVNRPAFQITENVHTKSPGNSNSPVSPEISKKSSEHDKLKERAEKLKSEKLQVLNKKQVPPSSESKKRKFEESSSEDDSDDDDSSSDSEVETQKRPRLVASLPSTVKRSQSPSSNQVSPANSNAQRKPSNLTPIKATQAKYPQSAPTKILSKSIVTPQSARPTINALSKSASKVGAKAELNVKPKSMLTAPKNSSTMKIKKPILNSLEDLALRGVPEVKESIDAKSGLKKKAPIHVEIESAGSESESDSSSDDDSSDDSDGDVRFLSMKKVTPINKPKKNFFGKMKR